MKTLLTLFASLILSLSASCQTNINDRFAAKFYDIRPFDTNLLQGLLECDRLSLNGLWSTVGPKLEFLSLPSNAGGFIWWAGDRFLISSNITVWGTINAYSNLLWQTNIVYATNSTYATNDQWGNVIVGTNAIYADTNLYKLAQAYYPTNSAATNTDMSVPYGDVNWVTGFYWPNLDSTKFSTTSYQTAVRILHGNGTATNFGWPIQVRIHGSPYITNRTICTFFYNPAVPETNLLILPLW